VSFFIYYYVECRYAECHYDECQYAECSYTECHYIECRGAAYIKKGLSIFSKLYLLSFNEALHYKLDQLLCPLVS
jgi:hypothetical protein